MMSTPKIKDQVQAVGHNEMTKKAFGGSLPVFSKLAFGVFAIITVAAIAAVITAAVHLFANPEADLDADMNAFIEKQILQHHHGQYYSGDFYCTDFKVLGTKKDNNNTTVYMWVLYREYVQENGNIKPVSGAYIPTAVTIKNENNALSLTAYWEARDGIYNERDIREKFPWYLIGKIIGRQPDYVQEQQVNCDKKAQAYFSSVSVSYQDIFSALHEWMDIDEFQMAEKLGGLINSRMDPTCEVNGNIFRCSYLTKRDFSDQDIYYKGLGYAEINNNNANFQIPFGLEIGMDMETVIAFLEEKNYQSYGDIADGPEKITLRGSGQYANTPELSCNLEITITLLCSDNRLSKTVIEIVPSHIE